MRLGRPERYRRYLARLCAFALACALPAAHGAIEIKDARGKQISLAQPAARVVTLSPHLAELVADAGGADRLVAVSRFTDFPAKMKDLPQIGDAGSIDFERLLQLKPDLVLAWETGNRIDQVTRLERLGITVFVTKQPHLRDVAETLRTLGELMATRNRADASAREFERALITLSAHYANARPVRTFVEIWHQPLITVGARHWIDEVLALCGGRNVFSDAAALTPSVSMEALYAANPEAIVGGDFVGAQKFTQAWQLHPALRAVQNNKLYYVDPDVLQRPTTRLIGGARALCAALQQARGTAN